ncbi:Sperm-associated antigen 17 [Gryllus bimaculatus]|nr:Sperm-associated antigen 17 [Gryllus bimaculatus]
MTDEMVNDLRGEEISARATKTVIPVAPTNVVVSQAAIEVQNFWPEFEQMLWNPVYYDSLKDVTLMSLVIPRVIVNMSDEMIKPYLYDEMATVVYDIAIRRTTELLKKAYCERMLTSSLSLPTHLPRIADSQRGASLYHTAMRALPSESDDVPLRLRAMLQQLESDASSNLLQVDGQTFPTLSVKQWDVAVLQVEYWLSETVRESEITSRSPSFADVSLVDVVKSELEIFLDKIIQQYGQSALSGGKVKFADPLVVVEGDTVLMRAFHVCFPATGAVEVLGNMAEARLWDELPRPASKTPGDPLRHFVALLTDRLRASHGVHASSATLLLEMVRSMAAPRALLPPGRPDYQNLKYRKIRGGRPLSQVAFLGLRCDKAPPPLPPRPHTPVLSSDVTSRSSGTSGSTPAAATPSSAATATSTSSTTTSASSASSAEARPDPGPAPAGTAGKAGGVRERWNGGGGSSAEQANGDDGERWDDVWSLVDEDSGEYSECRQSWQKAPTIDELHTPNDVLRFVEATMESPDYLAGIDLGTQHPEGQAPAAQAQQPQSAGQTQQSSDNVSLSNASASQVQRRLSGQNALETPDPPGAPFALEAHRYARELSPNILLQQLFQAQFTILDRIFNMKELPLLSHEYRESTSLSQSLERQVRGEGHRASQVEKQCFDCQYFRPTDVLLIRAHDPVDQDGLWHWRANVSLPSSEVGLRTPSSSRALSSNLNAQYDS